MSRGRFVTLEGIDGSGKSTQADLLAAALNDAGTPVVRAREPGGTPLGEAVRGILLGDEAPVSDASEVLLFAAARAQLVGDVIAPALASGSWVVCDRFLDSSLAYQGGGRGIGIDVVAQVNTLAVGENMPDVTVLLRIDPESAAVRRAGADDRIEAEGIALQRRVAAAYDQIAAAEPNRVRGVDADRPEAEVHAEILGIVGGLT